MPARGAREGGEPDEEEPGRGDEGGKETTDKGGSISTPVKKAVCTTVAGEPRADDESEGIGEPERADGWDEEAGSWTGRIGNPSAALRDAL